MNTERCCPQCTGQSNNTQCSPCVSNGKSPAYIQTLENACAIAFGIFGIYLEPISFGAGAALGAAYQVTLILWKVETKSEGEARPGCGQGNAVLFVGRGLHPIEIVAVTALFFYEHMQHHPRFFVPLLGFFLGVRSVVWLNEWYTPKPLPLNQ